MFGKNEKQNLSLNVYLNQDSSITVITFIGGCKKEDIDIRINGNDLNINVKRDVSKFVFPNGTSSVQVLNDELFLTGTFSGTVKIPFHLEKENIVTKYKDGLLLINIQKPLSNQVTKILPL